MAHPKPTGLTYPFDYARGGFAELVNGVQPAANTDFTLTLVGDYEVRALTVFCRLVTDANVASREVACQFRDGDGNVFATHGAGTTVPASQTAFYFFSVQFTSDVFTVDSTALCPLTAMFLEPGWSIRLHLVNGQAGDQLSQIRLNLERFETGHYAFEEGERYPAARAHAR